MTRAPKPTPMEVAYLSMCDRLDRFAAILCDPYTALSSKQRAAIVRACEAIEEEWILEPSMREPRNSGDD